MNIVIPLAGEGERFLNKGYDLPKPLIDVKGKPMIIRAVESLGLNGRYIFIIRTDHKKYGLDLLLQKEYPTSIIINIDYKTEGPACSALLAKNYINNTTPLIIANCDQIMEWDSEKFVKYINCNLIGHGTVVTYTSDSPKNSYVRLNKYGEAIELKEKEVISNVATNGIHYWRYGEDFVSSCEKLIESNERVNNEFYISMTYNHLIEHGKLITTYHIKNEEHNAIGTPEDLNNYLERYK